MVAVSTVGIVGAGAAGLALATFLADVGISTEILEKSHASSALGSGITLLQMRLNALRVSHGQLLQGLLPTVRPGTFHQV